MMFHIICRNCTKNQSLSHTIFNSFTVAPYSIKLNAHSNKFKHVGSEQYKLADIIQKYEGKLLYSGYFEEHRLKLGYKRNVIFMEKESREDDKRRQNMELIEPLPFSLKYIHTDHINELKLPTKDVKEIHENVTPHFPFDIKHKEAYYCATNVEEIKSEDKCKDLLDLEIKERLKYLKANNWMADYENYEETESEEINDWKVNYGTPDPNSSIGTIPCGGCGALLHCRDTSIPGYIPSEIYKNHTKRGGTTLQAIICQRCYFLNNYNLALQVQVLPENYPQVLKTIRARDKALVILIVDLLDFPCSIWPGAADLLGPGRPIILVGNKVDLLPQDGKGFLERVAQNLKCSARECGFAAADIKHICLISATTGFGVENLITKLYSYWETRGDVFLVGCTNVGKSSLFNALLQSDYCKSQATDLIQKATVSPWPGTTLNLLKFPILRMSGYRAYLRYQRLLHSQKQIAEENKLRKMQLLRTRNSKYATLIGHIGKTFTSEEPIDGGDMFSVKGNLNSLGITHVGIDERDKVYTLSKWCYDTPGVLQPEQLHHLLTTKELLATLPKKLIRPKTFCLQPGCSIFIGGLSRLDYVEGKPFARFTVFCSHGLPITICRTSIAFDLYEELLGTEFFAVPSGTLERLKFWPGLEESKEFTTKGIDWGCSCADIVLSSSGWIAIAGKAEVEYKVKAWVPKNCGIYLRESLLPGTVALRGKRIRDSPAYRSDKFYVKI